MGNDTKRSGRKALRLVSSCAFIMLVTQAGPAAAQDTSAAPPGPPAANVPAASVIPQDLPPSAASASPDTREGLGGEIVVTAQKRSQNVQDVGISITAVSGAELHQLGFTTSTDIAKIASNVSVSGSYGGMMSQFTIRGVTQNDFNDHVESVIATYIDDSYIAMQQGQFFAMFDLDRVEALKGPQGTLFGRNATGGLVQFITRKPTDHFEAYIDGTYASYNEARIEGAVGGPIAPGINFRLSGLFDHYDGYLKNAYPGNTYTPANTGKAQGGYPAPGAGADLGGIKSNAAVRGQVAAEITDNIKLSVEGMYNRFLGSSPPYQQSVNTVTVQDAAGVQIGTLIASPTETCEIIKAGACAPGYGEASSTRPVPGANYFGYKDPDGIGFKTSSDYAFKDGSQTRTYGGISKLVWDLGGPHLTWVNSYMHYTKHFLFDLDADPANSYFWIADSREKTLSEEVRIDGQSGPLTYVAGAYYLHINNHSTHGLGALPNSAYAVNGVGFDQPRIAHLVSKSYSLFGQLEYKLTDTLTAIGGLRASRELKDYDFTVLFVPTTAANSDPKQWDYVGGTSYGAYHAKNSKTLWNWKAQLDWKLDPNLLLYAGVTQGAKAGSFNSGDPSLLDNNGAAIPYKPERLISYEAGFKSSLMDRRLRFNGAAYYYDYHNYQAARWTGLSGVIINANGYFYGAEAELTGDLNSAIETSLNVGWQKNKLKHVPTGDGFANVETTFAPEWTVSGLFRYTYPEEIADGHVAIQGSGTYQSAVWQNLNNFAANRLKGWFTADARLSFTTSNNKYQVAVFAKNLFDKRYDVIGFDESYLTGSNLNSQGRPRWIGGNVRVNF